MAIVTNLVAKVTFLVRKVAKMTVKVPISRENLASEY